MSKSLHQCKAEKRPQASPSDAGIEVVHQAVFEEQIDLHYP